MSRVHGSWLALQNGYFFLWGETWRTIVVDTASTSVSLHPFNSTQPELISALQESNISLENVVDLTNLDRRWIKRVIILPSFAKKSEQFIPVLSGKIQTEAAENNSLFLHSWEVEGLILNSLETVNLFQIFPLAWEISAHDLGGDLRFWTQIYRWSFDLLSRSKFLPGILSKNETAKSCWQPLLDSNIDRDRLAKFLQLMPPICRAYYEEATTEIKLRDAQELLLDFLSSIIDARVRIFSENIPINNKGITVSPWLRSLGAKNPDLEIENKNIKRIENAIDNWTFPVRDYLIASSALKLKQNLYRACFALIPPEKERIKSGDADWQLKYNLQALDDPEFLIDAETIWQNSTAELAWQNRRIDRPQESLLKGLGFASRLYFPIEEILQESQPSGCQLNPIQAYEFIRSIAWQLQDNGLGVILPSGLRSDEGEQRLGIKISAEVSQKKGERLNLKSLLKYKLDIAIGEKAISKKEFESLLEQRSPIVEVNGEWIALQPADVRAAQEVLNKSNESIELSVEDALRLSTGDTKTLAKLPVFGFKASGVLAELINNLNNNQAIKPIETPETFSGQLRPYQKRGFSWLSFLERWGLGACLADDMGLGKTIQTIAFILNLKEQDLLAKPTLLVCPTSVLNNWEREVKKFAPTLSTLIHHGDKRSKGKNLAKQIKNKDLVITSYSLVYRDEKSLSDVEWHGIILDEAQNIKNPQAKQSQAVRKLPAGFRIALTGTPVENKLSELWSILDFLNPGFLGNRQFFQRRFAIPIEKYGDKDSLAILRSLVQPFILRRLKTDKTIIQDLPEKQEMNVFCGLSSEQAQLYQKLVDDSLKKIEEAEGIQRHGLILTLLLKLKQLCNHPAQLLKEKKLEKSDRSGKLLRLEEMLEEIIAEGDRALIFTQFSEWGKLLKPYLEQKLHKEVLFLYGATRRKQRQEMVDRFQNDPKAPHIFILSLKAGGTGLNLTRANHVFHVDRWWNPAVENQATDRVFRIGQKRNVQVHKFLCTGTLEEKINEIIESKKQLAEQTVDAGEQWLTQLDTDRLRNLLLLDRDAIIDDEA